MKLSTPGLSREGGEASCTSPGRDAPFQVQQHNKLLGIQDLEFIEDATGVTFPMDTIDFSEEMKRCCLGVNWMKRVV